MKTYEKTYKNWTGRFVVTVNNKPVDPASVIVEIDEQKYYIDPESKQLIPVQQQVEEHKDTQTNTPMKVSRVVPYPNKSDENRLKSILKEVARHHKTCNRGVMATCELLMFQILGFFKSKGIDLFEEINKAKDWYSEMNWAVRTHWIKKTDLPGYLRPAQVRDLTLLQIISTRPEWRALCEEFLTGRYLLTVLEY